MTNKQKSELDEVIAEMAADWIRAVDDQAEPCYTVQQIGIVLGGLKVRVSHEAPATGFRTRGATSFTGLEA